MNKTKEIRDRIVSSPEYKRNTYIRRMTAIYILASGAFFGVIAFAVEKYFGISGYLTCSVAGVMAITFSVLGAKKSKH